MLWLLGLTVGWLLVGAADGSWTDLVTFNAKMSEINDHVTSLDRAFNQCGILKLKPEWTQHWQAFMQGWSAFYTQTGTRYGLVPVLFVKKAKDFAESLQTWADFYKQGCQ